MKNRRFYAVCSFLADLLIFVMALYAVGTSISAHAALEFNGSGLYTFRYFTTDSNVFCGILSLVAAAFTLPVVLNKRESVPKAVLVLKYIGTVAVALTFFVVIVFLGPIYGYGMMYRGASFYLHGIVPFLAMVSWIVFDRGCHLKLRAIFLTLVPVALYGVVYFYKVVVLGPARGGWQDFYALARGGKWWLSIILMGAGTLLISFILMILHNRCDRESAEKKHNQSAGL